MRVLTFTSLFPNSVQPNLGIFVYQRMAAFAALTGNEVEVIAPVPYAPGWLPGERSRSLASIPKQEVVGGIRAHHPRYALVPKISMPLHARLMKAGCIGLARELHVARRPFDLIDAHFIYPDATAAIWIARALKIPAVVSARGTDMTLFPSFRLIRPQIRATLREAKGRIAVSRSLQAAMQEVAGEAYEVRVIGNGVDPARFFPVERAEARRTLGIAADAAVIVCVAALVVVKRQDVLIRAVQALRSEFPKLQLYLVGEGASRRGLEELVAELGLRETVRLVGACANERLRFWYSAADVSVLVSAREGWPNVLLESLACGTPVVATRVGGVPEVLTSPEFGLLVDQSMESLVAGLRQGLERDWNKAGLVAYARRRDWSTVARELERYFREVLERAAPKTEIPAAV